MQNNKTSKGITILFTASILWGLAFCFQSIGGREAGAYTYNGLRMLLGALCMIPIIWIFDIKGLSPNRPHNNKERKKLWKMGTACGVLLAIATNLQQVALNLGAEAGRAGFLTSIYILIIPVIGLFLKKKLSFNIWIGVAVALAGMYFLCIEGEFAIAVPDLLLILSAVAFALHIAVIDTIASDVDALRFTAVQFLICGIISAVLMTIFEIIPAEGGFAGWANIFTSGSFWIALVYVAVFSGCVGYTLQILGQRMLAPPVASLVMCMESVFSVIFGYLILHEEMTGRQLLGCGLILVSVIIVQIRFFRQKKSTG